MAKYFETDGFRGEAGITLTADHAYKIGRFLGSVFKSKPIYYGITDEIPRFLTKSHRTLKIA